MPNKTKTKMHTCKAGALLYPVMHLVTGNRKPLPLITAMITGESAITHEASDHFVINITHAVARLNLV